MRALALGALISACSSHPVDAVVGCDENCADASGEPRPRPIHRYSFDPTTSNEVLDSIGARHGTLVGARYGTDQDLGSVVFAGESQAEYVDLPKHLLWGLRNATFESWVSWRGGSSWQRVFDFGEDETGVPGSRTVPRSYLFLAFKPEPRAAFKKPPSSSAEVIVDAGFPMPENVLTHLAVVVNEDGQRLALYVDGRIAAESQFVDSLSDVYDVNAWLGRSLFRLDADFGGSISEFRIYDQALGEEQLLRSYESGPDVRLEAQ